jgi:hypothetical protein
MSEHDRDACSPRTPAKAVKRGAVAVAVSR